MIVFIYFVLVNTFNKNLINGLVEIKTDKLIQDIQLTNYISRILEWILYNKFDDIKYIAERGFAKVYSATWTDSDIKKWDQKSNNWKRSGLTKVALKVFNNSSNLSKDFINEVQ